MLKTIQIEITKEDAEKAVFYDSVTGCLLATALTRLGYNFKYVGFSDVCINGEVYDFYSRQIRNSYDSDGLKVELDRFKPFTVTLWAE